MITLTIFSVLNFALLLYLAYEKSQSKKANADDVAELISDMRRYGFTFLRISPDDVTYRSPRARG